jgi:excisionase family DNA binding protein
VSGTQLTAAVPAAVLNVPKSWVYELARQGRLPCRRLGRYVRFDLAAVEGALASNSKTANLGHEKNPRRNGRLRNAATTLLPPQPAAESLP